MDKKLQANIQHLYQVFAKYQGNEQMSGSPNYGDAVQDWNKALFAKRLSALSANDLVRFTGKALTTWGTVRDLKHFLPRILELTAAYDTPYEIWIALDKLSLGHWTEWEATEKELICDYLVLLFEKLFRDDSILAEINFIDYFTAILYFYPKADELLACLEGISDKAKYKHLAKLIVEQGDLIFRKGKINGFYKTDKHVKTLQQWLLRKSLVEEFEQAFFKYEKEEFAAPLSWAAQILSEAIEEAG